MGTRHSTMVFKDGQYKVAQYGQWDGYPDGQGLTVLKFLHGMNREEFLARLDKCRQISTERYKALWAELGHVSGNSWVSIDISQRFEERHPHLHRDCGAQILFLVAAAPDGLDLNYDLNFPGDSLLCEWAYVVDFDKDVFEAYKGFNKTPLVDGDRFFHLSPHERKNWQDGTTVYHPVRLVRFWPLSDLPSEEDFLAAFADNDEPDEAED